MVGVVLRGMNTRHKKPKEKTQSIVVPEATNGRGVRITEGRVEAVVESCKKTQNAAGARPRGLGQNLGIIR